MVSIEESNSIWDRRYVTIINRDDSITYRSRGVYGYDYLFKKIQDNWYSGSLIDIYSRDNDEDDVPFLDNEDDIERLKVQLHVFKIGREVIRATLYNDKIWIPTDPGYIKYHLNIDKIEDFNGHIRTVLKMIIDYQSTIQ